METVFELAKEATDRWIDWTESDSESLDSDEYTALANAMAKLEDAFGVAV